MIGFANGAQLNELFLSGGMGFLLGAYYDVFRVIRQLIRPGTVRVFFEDVLYFTSSALITFLFLLAVNGGVFRVYVCVALAAGFVAYRYTVGRVVVKAVTLLLTKLTVCGRAVGRWIAAPFARLGAVIEKIQKNRRNLKKGLETDGGTGV